MNMKLRKCLLLIMPLSMMDDENTYLEDDGEDHDHHRDESETEIHYKH